MLRHGLLSQFAVQMIEFIQAGRKRGYHVAPQALLLLPVDVVTQGIIEHCLKLSPLVLGNGSQSLQYFRGSL
jgi:hypothetical protein